MCPQGGSRWLGLSELCHPKLHWGEGARIGGETSNELRKAGTKAKIDDLISQPQRNKAPTSPL